MHNFGLVSELIEPVGVVAHVDLGIGVDGEHFDHVDVVQRLVTLHTRCTCDAIHAWVHGHAMMNDDGADAGDGEHDKHNEGDEQEERRCGVACVPEISF